MTDFVGEKDGVLRIAIVGVGGVADAHISSLRYLRESGYQIEICAGVNRSEENRRRAQERYGISQMFADARHMVEQVKPDALYVLVPWRSLAQVTGELIPYRVPILMEKPPGGSVEECAQLAELAARYKTPVMVGFNRRFYSLVRKALDLCQAQGGLLGINMEVSEYLSRLKKRPDLQVETLDDVYGSRIVHCIDLVRRMAGNITDVKAFATCEDSSVGTDRCVALMISDRGIPVTCYAYHQSVGNWHYDLFARDLRIRFENLETAFLQRRGEAEVLLEPDACDVAVKPGMVAQSRHFVDCLLGDGRIGPPASSIHDALETMKLVETLRQGNLYESFLSDQSMVANAEKEVAL